MSAPADRVYTTTHEWHKTEGDVIAIGLTRHAVDSLTDVTYVEMKPAGTEVSAGDSIGEVESVKTTSEVYSAVSGLITEVNEVLNDNPGLLNEDPYEHWLVKIRPTDTTGLSACVDAATYEREHAV
ncbi:MAG: glycine cleavage system protein GcvH [Phycisphaerales bacterium]